MSHVRRIDSWGRGHRRRRHSVWVDNERGNIVVFSTVVFCVVVFRLLRCGRCRILIVGRSSTQFLICVYLCKICFQMGTLLSKCDTKFKCSDLDDGYGVSWRWKGPPGDHSPYPFETYAGNDHEVLYCFVDVFVAFKILSK